METLNNSTQRSTTVFDEMKRADLRTYQKPIISMLGLAEIIAGSGGSILDADQFSSQPEIGGRPARRRS